MSKDLAKPSVDEDIYPTEYLTIRLGEDEDRALTRLRGGYEFFESHRWNIKELLNKIITDAAVLHQQGEFELPVFSPLPGLLKKNENVKQISLKKNAQESTALMILSLRQDGSRLTYGQADMVRILINLAEIDRTKKLKELLVPEKTLARSTQ